MATWTPTDGSGAGLKLTVNDTRWVRFGRICVVCFDIRFPATENGEVAKIDGLPIPAFAGTNSVGGGAVSYTDQGEPITALVGNAQTSLNFYRYDGSGLTNAGLSGKQVRGTITYITN